MGDVKKIGRKIEKTVTEPIKKVVDGVGGVGQDIIDVTIKPARDITLAGAQAATNLVNTVGENPELLMAGAAAYLGGQPLLGSLGGQPLLGQAQGLLDRKEVISSPSPIVLNGGGGNAPSNNNNIILIVGGLSIALVLFLTLKKR